MPAKTTRTVPYLAAALCALSAGGAVAEDVLARPQTAADQDDVYFIAQLVVDDMEAFQAEYVPGTAALLGESSALILAITPTPQVIEGEWGSNWTVLMRFDDQADFQAFYEDPDYQVGFVPIRLAAASVNNLVVLPAFDPETFAGR